MVMKRWFVIIGLLVWSMGVSGQQTNRDYKTNMVMLARFAETKAQLELLAVEAATQQKAARDERLKADSLMEYSINRFFDYAPGIIERGKVWVTIEGLMKAGSSLVFKDGMDTVLTNKMKEIRIRFISPDKVKTVPGDLVWREYMDFFKRAEKALTGTDHFGGIIATYEQIQGFASGNVASIGTTVLNKVQQKGQDNEEQKPLLKSDYIKDETMRKAFMAEAENIMLQVVQMHNSWVPSADKRVFYDTKRQELISLAGNVRKGFSIDYVIGNGNRDQDLIWDDYSRYLKYGLEKE